MFKMTFCQRVLLALLVLFIAFVIQTYIKYLRPTVIPDYDLNQYWGPGEPKKDNKDIKSFKFDLPNERLEKLIEQLNDTSRLVPVLEEVNFEYGTNQNYLKEIIPFWRDSYLRGRWDDNQDFLNMFPHFKTEIQGLKIHFVHAKPEIKDNKKVKRVPILLLHGWPGSVAEFWRLIPILIKESDSRDFVFEVIVPSLPGFGFSDAPAKPGLSPTKMAVIFRNLMLRLGFKKFYVQGGDWGAMVGASLTVLFPENVKGYHSNFCASISSMSPLSLLKNFIISLAPSFFIDEERIDWYFPKNDSSSGLIHIILQEGGYFHLQATKPDTVGAAFGNNPIGIAAYIIEKVSTATERSYIHEYDGGFEQDILLDIVLDNLMYYIVPNSMPTAVRIYKEAVDDFEGSRAIRSIPIRTPTACLVLKNEVMLPTEWTMRDHFLNLVQVTYSEKGGHFAAMQLPELMDKDITEFVTKVEQ